MKGTSIKIKIKNFLWKLALKYLVNPKKIIKIGSNKMYLDSKDSLLLSLRKNYEPEHVALIKKVVKKGDIVIDAGAHIGYYTLILAEAVGPTGKVFSFEPNPKNFEVLKKNVAVNGYKHVVLEQKAVSNKNGKVKFYFSDINSGDGTIYATSEDRKSCEVESVRLDDYFKNKLKPTFFKMDIQGMEPSAFEGMQSILSNPYLKFSIEFYPAGLESAGYKPQEFLDKIMKKGFRLYDLDKKKIAKDENSITEYYNSINYFTTLYCYK
jgi:FkbM family methyltransferase